MLFRFDQLLLSLSSGLDAIEKEILGTTTNHGKRLAILTSAMGRQLKLDGNQMVCLVSCALLHDNAVGEYRLHMRSQGGETQETNMQPHCERGEENVLFLPFPCNVAGYIKYHHEFNDLSGPFGLCSEKLPLGSQIIALADHLDVTLDLHTENKISTDELREYIQQRNGNLYTKQAADALLTVLTPALLSCLADSNVDKYLEETMPHWIINRPATELMPIAETLARITDYKSKFTAKHSVQIANRAYFMAKQYGFDEEICAQLYIAAALHDIGKLITPVDVLEKPGKLTEEEYEIIKGHVYSSYMMLKDVDGLEEICRWAVTHHRKLNNSGYPDLPKIYLTNDFMYRLMTCIDIYQAVRETRPYHERRTHEQTMEIMWTMANRGEIDKSITNDMDDLMAQFTQCDGDVPSPRMQSSAEPR